MPPAPAPAPAPPPPPPPSHPHPPHKCVTFCTHRDTSHARGACDARDARSAYSHNDLRYYSDPGNRKPKQRKSDSIDSDVRYYSEPDVKYFEIDYEFLKELRRIARNNCPKCKRRRSRRYEECRRRERARETYVLCNGRYHSEKEHCRVCCRICNRSTDTLDSMEDEYSLVSRSYSLPSSKATGSSRSRFTPSRRHRARRSSVQSNKSVSFLESSNDDSTKDEPNYTAKSFTNDLKRFLLKPSPPRLSLRDKFIISFKQEIEATRKSPKLKAIRGLWKSY